MAASFLASITQIGIAIGEGHISNIQVYISSTLIQCPSLLSNNKTN
jgi:hypothetical protein